jgi:lipopolysaccharide export LptBFGC system permease protein LptF
VKILDRHVLREFGAACLVAFSFFTLLFLALHLFTHLSDFGEARESFASRGWSVFVGGCRYYAVALPFVLVTAGPFALLLAGMGAAQRLAKDAETIAAQAAGVGLRRFTAPLVVGGAVCAALLGLVREEGLPRLAFERLTMERLLRGQAKAAISGALVFEDGRGNKIHAQAYDPGERVAYGVRIVSSADLSRRADVGRMRHDGEKWIALDSVKGDASLVDETDLRPREIEIDARGLRQLRRVELEELMERLPDRRDLVVLWHARWTYPIGAVVLLVLGVALVLRGDRRNVYAAAGAGLLLSVVYFAVENVLHGVAERELWLPPALAAWLPPLGFGVAGGVLYSET